jgi:hypothetical protein
MITDEVGQQPESRSISSAACRRFGHGATIKPAFTACQDRESVKGGTAAIFFQRFQAPARPYTAA